MIENYILNGQASGSVASRLMQNGFDPNCLRLYVDSKGRTRQPTINEDGKPSSRIITNAPATLRKDDWIILDDAIVRAGRERLRAVADLRSAGLQFTIPNGLGKTVLETEKQSNINEAEVSMDGLRQSQYDRPEFDLASLPLPIIHKDFYFSARQLAASRNGGSPLDTTMAELAARRVAEEAEKLLLGVSSSFAYGGGTIFGYTNFPDRLTKTITAPTFSSWTGATLVGEVLEMRQQSQEAFHFGPWAIYVGPAWDVFMDDDYSTLKGDNTLRQRLEQITGIQEVRTVDFFTDFTLVLVQLTSDVARMVIGMDLTTVQWETLGGMQINFKVMAIMVPQLRSDFNNKTGIVHGSTV